MENEKLGNEDIRSTICLMSFSGVQALKESPKWAMKGGKGEHVSNSTATAEQLQEVERFARMSNACCLKLHFVKHKSKQTNADEIAHFCEDKVQTEDS